jgi:hypothetical protein
MIYSVIKFAGGIAHGKSFYVTATPYKYVMDQSSVNLHPSVSDEPRLDAAFESTAYELTGMPDGSLEYHLMEDD